MDDAKRLGPGWTGHTDEERKKAVQIIAETVKIQEAFAVREKDALLRQAFHADVITETRFTFTHVCKRCLNAETCPPGTPPYEHLMDFLKRHGACQVTP